MGLATGGCPGNPSTEEAVADLSIDGPSGTVPVGSEFQIKTIAGVGPSDLSHTSTTTLRIADESIVAPVTITVVAGYTRSSLQGPKVIAWSSGGAHNEADFILQCLAPGQTNVSVTLTYESGAAGLDAASTESWDVVCEAESSGDTSTGGDTDSGDDVSDVSADGSDGDTGPGSEGDDDGTTGGETWPSADVYVPSEFSELIGAARLSPDGTYLITDDQPFESGAPSSAGAATPDGAFFFTGGFDGFSVMQRDGSTGVLTYDAPNLAHHTTAGAMSVSPDGGTLFVSDINDASLTSYAIEADGRLSGGETVATGETPRQTVSSADGGDLYLAYGGLNGGGVQTFATGAAGEAPTLVSDETPFANPTSLALSPDEACLYLGTGSGIAVFERDADGVVADTGQVFASPQIGSLSVTPDDAFVVASTAFDATVLSVARANGCALEATAASEIPKIGFNGEISDSFSTPDGSAFFELSVGGELRLDSVAEDGTLTPGPLVEVGGGGFRPVVVLNP
ncbi:MAG: beta-propeller fold lactonase family protein [Myxococcota bacterium]